MLRNVTDFHYDMKYIIYLSKSIFYVQVFTINFLYQYFLKEISKYDPDFYITSNCT